MRGPDETDFAAVETAILAEDYETAATLLSTLDVRMRSSAETHVTVGQYFEWLRQVLDRMKARRAHLSQRLSQIRPDAYGRVAEAHRTNGNSAGWVGGIAVIACFLATGLYAAEQKTVLERQLGAAKRQQEATNKRQKPAASFFQTPWLSDVTAPPETAIASTETVASQPSGTASLPPPPGDCPRIESEELDQMIGRVPLGPVSPKLVSAVIAQESGGRPCAVSSKGAMGLMQLMPDLASDLKVTDPFDPEQNLGAGVRYLSQLMDRYRGDLRLVLAAYNAGPARVDSSGGVPDIEETKAYVASILRKVQP